MLRCGRCGDLVDTDFHPESIREGFDDECICDSCYDDAILDEAPEMIANAIRKEKALKAENAALKDKIQKLRQAAQMIHSRHGMVSGSLAMAECDAFLKELNLPVWTWK
jgi:hypothetical protein